MAGKRFPGTPQSLSRCRGISCGFQPGTFARREGQHAQDGECWEPEPRQTRAWEEAPTLLRAEASCRQGLSGAHPSPGGHGHGFLRASRAPRLSLQPPSP